MADDYDRAEEEFNQILKRFTLRAACGREYVLVAKLAQWLKVEVTVANYKTTRLDLLLAAAYRIRRGNALPVEREHLLLDGGCLMVFSILLEMCMGKFIHILLGHRRGDHHLPLSVERLEEILKIAAQGRDCQLSSSAIVKLSEDFVRRQWKFCPAKLDLRPPGRTYPFQQIMPFTRKAEINEKGGTAQLFQVEVLEEFVGEPLRDAVKNSVYDPKHHPSDDGLGKRYELVVKTFQDGNKDLFDNEIDAFKMLHREDAIIRYLGAFTHQSEPSTTTEGTVITSNATYNIILEFGEADLQEHFTSTSPPYLQEEIEAFWNGLRDVAVAVKSIHLLKRDQHGPIQKFSGWHADIKPDNIIVVQQKFKLADPGFAKFVQWTDKPPKTSLSGGTETYGAPEWYHALKTRGKVTQAIDVWSLGCVLSIAATWVIHGHQGILQYNELRKMAIDDLANSQSKLLDREKTINRGDYFHDGKKVLTKVTEWHSLLRNTLRPTDKVTGHVLDLIDQEMLLQDPGQRIDATTTCRRLEEIIKKAEAEPRIYVPSSIAQMLRKVDDDASSSKGRSSINYPSGSFLGSAVLGGSTVSTTTLTIAEERRSNFLGAPILKTTHRSIVLPPLPLDSSENAPETFGNVPERPAHSQTSHYSSLLERISTPPDRLATIEEHPESYHIHRNSDGSLVSELATPSRPNGPRRFKSGALQDRQNVFQAREEMEREKDHWRGPWAKKRLDKRLSAYFKDRDIKYLVDNGESMALLWFEATYLLETLVLKARGQDKTGMDLSFTIGNVTVQGKDKWLPFNAAMSESTPQVGSRTRTDLRRPLGDILDEYLTNARRVMKSNYTKLRTLTLIILTDGAWEGMKDKDEVRSKIVSFVRSLTDVVGDLKERPVSIEFIQLGNDPDATERFWRLDNLLKFDYNIPDIIDHERMFISGDVNKMLLGSFVEDWDENEDDEEAISSPKSALNAVDYFSTIIPTMRSSTFQSNSTLDQTPPASGFTGPAQGDPASSHPPVPSMNVRTPTMDSKRSSMAEKRRNR